VEFDQLYRSHLANVYRFLNLTPPEELSRTILRVQLPEVHVAPSGPIIPMIDGEVTSYFEWIGAGVYRVDERSGSMHGKKFLVKEVHFGSDGSNFYLRVDFHTGCERELPRMEARLTAQTLDGAHSSSVEIGFANDDAQVTGMNLAASVTDRPVDCAFARVLEVRISLRSMGVEHGGGLRFQFLLWQSGLPVDAVPQQGWLELRTTDPIEMAG
jgi:hypothetical protein